MRKVLVVTGTRAEYGLMYWLLKYLDKEPNIDLSIVVTGMHLSPEFGLTYKEIEKDFKISGKVEMILSSDTSMGIVKSMGLAQISFSQIFETNKPDLMVVLGDRFEIFSVVASAMVYKIPVAHIHGGEATEGLIDEPIRHSITKMSHIHFTATETYRNRVIQLGEEPSRVFNVGTPGLDNIFKLDLLDKEDLENSLNFNFKKTNVLVTYHPVTLENNTSEDQILNLLAALDKFDDIGIIFTMPNADTDGRIIIKHIENYVKLNPSRTALYSSLGQLRYLSTLKFVDVVIGNSSSGLSEVPSFKIPTVNIGERQKGRIKAKSVIDTSSDKLSIEDGVRKALSEEFRLKIRDVANPYGEGGASEKIKDIILNFDLKNIIKKSFFDIKFKTDE